MNCQDATLSLGVYLLGALEPTERAEVDAHLRDCAACQRELAELAGLPSILEQLELDDIEPRTPGAPITPSADLFERVAARARDEESAQRRRGQARYRRLAAVAAAVVVLGGAGIGAVVATHGGGGAAGSRTVSAVRGPVHMKVTLTSQTAGTALDVNVAGLPENEHCWLLAIGSDGSRHLAFQWDATYGGRARVTGSTEIPLNRLSKLVLLGSNRQPLDEVAV
jgi:hypothetical protein